MNTTPFLVYTNRWKKFVSVWVITPVSSTNKTDRHDITEILLKVALNTINQPTNLVYRHMTNSIFASQGLQSAYPTLHSWVSGVISYFQRLLLSLSLLIDTSSWITYTSYLHYIPPSFANYKIKYSCLYWSWSVTALKIKLGFLFQKDKNTPPPLPH